MPLNLLKISFYFYAIIPKYTKRLGVTQGLLSENQKHINVTVGDKKKIMLLVLQRHEFISSSLWVKKVNILYPWVETGDA